jgi:hypothetical protein
MSTAVDDSNNSGHNSSGIPAIDIASSSALYGSSTASATAAALATLMICNDADMRARPPRLMGPGGELHTPYNWDAAVSVSYYKCIVYTFMHTAFTINVQPMQ